MNQENKYPTRILNQEKYAFLTYSNKFAKSVEDEASITPKRPLLARDRLYEALIDVSPLTDFNSRANHSSKPSPSKSLAIRSDRFPVSINESHAFSISPPASSRSVSTIDNDENCDPPPIISRKARPAPASTWKAPPSIPKSSSTLKMNLELPTLPPPTEELPPTVSFQPAIRARVPFNLSSSNTIEKQTHAYTLWLNTLFTPVDYMTNPTNSTVDQSTSNDEIRGKSLKCFVESTRWHALCDRAREVFAHDIQPIAAKITADIDFENCRINPKADMNFSSRTVNRQALFNFLSSYNRIWFRLAMEIVFPVKIETYQQMKLAIDQYLIQSNEPNPKRYNPKIASAQIRLTIKNLLIIVIFLERAKLLRLIETDPCLYNRDAKFKSTKDALDVLSRDFISSDTNLLRRLKLAGYEPIYRQTSFDEYNYLITTNPENKLFEDLKDGIRLTRCAQILLSSKNEQIARLDLSHRLKCPVVNLVHKLLNLDQAFELLQTYGDVNLSGISNKDIMHGNKQRTLELLWRIFLACFLPKQLSPIDRLNDEISILKKNLSHFCTRDVERQLCNNEILPLQKQSIDCPPIVHSLIKWVQLICAHYKFWIYDLQQSFADGRAFLFIISYYFPSICDYIQDIKHLTTLATCQTREEHLQFNSELGQQQNSHLYERNVKANFRFLEECIKQIGSFSPDFVKYEFYAKDLPDERCTLMILAMLAHDLLFFNTLIANNEFDYRSQTIFEELKEKYVDDHHQISIEIVKEENHHRRILSREDSETITEHSFNPSIVSTSTEIPIEERISVPLINDVYPIPIIHIETNVSPSTNHEEEEEEETKSSPPGIEEMPVEEPSTAVLQTMNQDILDRLELMTEWLGDRDENERDEAEESFNTARSASTTMFDQRRASITAAMATLSLDDFVELEKTIENEEMKNNFTRASSCFIDETILSEVDSLETNKSEEASFTDPHHAKMLKETMMLFLNNEQQPQTSEISSKTKNKDPSTIEQQIAAATLLQSHWRGHRIRQRNRHDHHPIVPICERISSMGSTPSSSLTLRERMVQLVREYSDLSSSSVTAYLHLIRAMKPLITYSLELRHLIAEQGLLRLFFILMKCCNRSEPSNVLLSEVLDFLKLFTVNAALTMKLIDKQEYLKDFNMLILKYYQNNGAELFEQICSLLQSIVEHSQTRKILRMNKSFMDAIEYIYKRLYNKASIDEDKYHQRVRSTPKQSTASTIRRMKLLNRSSIIHPTPKLVRSSMICNENIPTKNLRSIEKFMKVFYCD